MCHPLKSTRGVNSTKYRISEKGRDQSLLKATLCLVDKVATRITHIDFDEPVFRADNYYLVKCFAIYIEKYQL